MQKSYSVGHPTKKHIPALKALWENVFGDSKDIINKFFTETASCENTFCAFCEGKPVSVMYAVESSVLCGGKEYNAYYVYAVCTHKAHRGNSLMKKVLAFLEDEAIKRGVSYLYLVPAEESLFSLYEKAGFKVGFTQQEALFKKNEVTQSAVQFKTLSFDEYKLLRKRNITVPQAILTEKGFNSFYRSVEGNINCICLNEGYAVYEKENGRATVHELCGEKKTLLNAVFSLSAVDELLLKEPAENGGKPYGMVKALGDVPLFTNGFFGIPYGG